MKNIFKIIFLMSLLLSLGAANAAQIKIITTTTDLQSITEEIAGNLAEVTSLTSGKEDPHSLTSRPSFVVKARQADLWIRIGLELEIGWESAVLRDSRNSKIQIGSEGHLDVSQNIERLDVPQAHIGRESGDVHPLGNPHYWLDPLNGRIIAKNICNKLSQLFPEHKETFNTNLKSFEEKIDQHMFGKELLARSASGASLWLKQVNGKLEDYLKSNGLKADPNSWYGRLSPYKASPIAIYHRSWIYFLRRFGLELAGELEPKPGIPPGPKYLSSLAESLKNKNVLVVLQEPFYSTKAAKIVSKKTNAKIVVAPNCSKGGENCENYIAMIDNLVGKLSSELKR